MVQRMIARDSLGPLIKIGQGIRGIVYQTPMAGSEFADAMVFKEYQPQARGHVNFDALAAMPTLGNELLLPADGKELISIAAWPCAIVETDTAPVGFVMPAIPEDFFLDILTVEGVSRTTAEFQHLPAQDQICHRPEGRRNQRRRRAQAPPSPRRIPPRAW